MANRFNGAGDDFGDLEDDGDDYNVSLDGSPMPDGSADADKDDADTGDAANDDDMFDDPVSEDSDAYDPNAILQTAEADGDYTNDEFEPSRQPGTPPREEPSDDQDEGRVQEQAPEPEPGQSDNQDASAEDEQIDFTGDDQTAAYPDADGQAAYADQRYQDPQAFQQPLQQPPMQWTQNEGFGQPAPGQQYPPQWVQQQYPQYPQQNGYQQMGGMQDDGGYQQNPATAAQQYPQDEPVVESSPAATAMPQEDAPMRQEETASADTQDGTAYEEPGGQANESEDVDNEMTAERGADGRDDDAIPSVTTEIPESSMIAKIISLADNIRNDLSNEERGALRKILDVKEPDYGENNDEGKEDIMDSANMVFNSLRMKKSILDAFDDLLSAQSDNDSDRAFFLIRQNDQDLRHIIEICRKFVDNNQKTDSSHLHVSLAEIAAHCISALSDDDVRLLQAARKTLELSREILHG